MKQLVTLSDLAQILTISLSHYLATFSGFLLKTRWKKSSFVSQPPYITQNVFARTNSITVNVYLLLKSNTNQSIRGYQEFKKNENIVRSPHKLYKMWAAFKINKIIIFYK